MRIAILSDIHDNLWNLAAAISSVQAADALICCGDPCSPFVIDELAKFPGEIHIVFGNNDADLYRITAKAVRLPRIGVHGELFQDVFDQKRFAVNHFDYELNQWLNPEIMMWFASGTTTNLKFRAKPVACGSIQDRSWARSFRVGNGRIQRRVLWSTTPRRTRRRRLSSIRRQNLFSQPEQIFLETGNNRQGDDLRGVVGVQLENFFLKGREAFRSSLDE